MCNHNYDQLFYIWFGWQIILLTVDIDVRMELYLSLTVWSNYNMSFLDRLPFNEQTPFGYLIALLYGFLTILSTVFCILPIVCFVIGSNLLITSFIKDITKNDFPILRDKISNGYHNELNAQFCGFMRNFSEIKQLSGDFFLKLSVIFLNYGLWILNFLLTFYLGWWKN